jgi:hypothetical protein
MKKEFIPHELALKLKQLGFNEPCFGYYLEDGNWAPASYTYDGTKYPSNSDLLPMWASSPTWKSAFGWFREKHGAVCEIIRKEDRNHSEFIGWIYIDNKKIDVTSYWASKKYEEAELACLQKLIEIVEKLKSE